MCQVLYVHTCVCMYSCVSTNMYTYQIYIHMYRVYVHTYVFMQYVCIAYVRVYVYIHPHLCEGPIGYIIYELVYGSWYTCCLVGVALIFPTQPDLFTVAV